MAQLKDNQLKEPYMEYQFCLSLHDLLVTEIIYLVLKHFATIANRSVLSSWRR